MLGPLGRAVMRRTIGCWGRTASCRHHQLTTLISGGLLRRDKCAGRGYDTIYLTNCHDSVLTKITQ
jgi:hypothetical protein